jgi:2-C-methyl-D-erythritol 4-phosphate cytidylyltransferase/2-C-methyl-D-erythritol 2,4-cyclodiphosphate synthase
VSTWTIVVAAGGATRFGRPKQYELLAGRRVLDWSLAAAREASDGVVLVVPERHGADGEPAADVVVAGAATRGGSVRCGLAVVPTDADVVVVHDAARPLAGAELFRAAVGAVRAGAAGAVCAVPVADTIKRVTGAVVAETLDRSQLWSVQTPQAFRADSLRAAHAGNGEATDDAALVEAAGGRVVVVAGDPRNFKLTRPEDLVMAEAVTGAAAFRVGQGYDVHAFSDDPARPLVLGGVVFDGERGLCGHSDADVVAHAIADALLGAAGLGDLGHHFPDTDEAWSGADSMALLDEVVRRLADQGWCAANADCTVVLEKPRLAPRRVAMEARLEAVLAAPVSVKAARAEGLGALGRGEGIACSAVALVRRR